MPEKMLRDFEQHLAETMTVLAAKFNLQENIPELYEALLADIIPGGRRLRPLLLLSTVNGYGDAPDRTAYGVAIALELLHTFALIHDDIIDESSQRRGRPALALALEAATPQQGRISHGTKRAILGGDIIYTLALTVFEDGLDNHPRARDCRNLLYEIAVKTGFGVFAEVSSRVKKLADLTLEMMSNLHDHKTSLYSFVLPLQLGALLANAPDGELPVLDSFGRSLGQAYQTRDDLDDLNLFLNHNGCMLTSELHLNLPILLAYVEADEKEQQELSDMLEKNRLDRNERKWIQKLLIKTSALAKAELMLSKHLCEAQKAAAEINMSPEAYATIDKLTAALFAEKSTKPQSAPCPR